MSSNDDEIILTGQFRYITKRCCCTKITVLNFKLTKDNLLFYVDKKNNLFLKIPRSDVIAINKRQVDKNDIFKFSIYYQNPNEDIIHEIKLKTVSRSETDRWIRELREEIKPKKYEFKYDKENYIDANEVYHFRDMRKFYLALCHLEYILLRSHMKNFFEYYHNKKNIDSENDNDINNNDSNIFGYENDTEKLNQEGNNDNNRLDIEDIKPKINDIK